jgi:hypothetical protein
MVGNNQHNSINTKEFIKRAKEIHGDRYLYDKVDYKNYKDKILIYCTVCEDYFEQRPHNHLFGKGCKSCAMKKLFDIRKKRSERNVDNFEQSNNKNTSVVEQEREVNILTKVTTFCEKHGEITLLLKSYKLNKGCCSQCLVEENRIKKQELIKLQLLEKFKNVHKGRYDYKNIEFKNNRYVVNAKCNIHGEFTTDAYRHSAGGNCSKCARIEGTKKTIGFTKEGWLLLSRKKYTLYLMQLEKKGEVFFKIGITTHLKERFRKISYDCTRYKIIESKNGELIYDLEKQLHKEFQQLCYEPKERFAGWTECFNPDKRISKRFSELKQEIENGISLD